MAFITKLYVISLNMKIEILKNEFKKGYENLEMEYDKVLMTWGVSHYRFVKGQKVIFSSMEQFFKEVMLSPEGLEGSVGDEIPWNQRTNFTNFINGLTIMNSDELILSNWLRIALKEGKEYEKDWQDVNKKGFDGLELPNKHENVLKIEETESPRFYINTYTGFVSENNLEYFFFEDQSES